MRNTGNRFIPGIRIEVKEEEPEAEIIFENLKSSNPANGTTAGNGILDKLVGIHVTTEEIPTDDNGVTSLRDDADVDNDANGDDDVEESFVVPSGAVPLMFTNFLTKYFT